MDRPALTSFFDKFRDNADGTGGFELTYTEGANDGQVYTAKFHFDVYLYVDETFNAYQTALSDGTIENPTTL